MGYRTFPPADQAAGLQIPCPEPRHGTGAGGGHGYHPWRAQGQSANVRLSQQAQQPRGSSRRTAGWLVLTVTQRSTFAWLALRCHGSTAACKLLIQQNNIYCCAAGCGGAVRRAARGEACVGQHRNVHLWAQQQSQEVHEHAGGQNEPALLVLTCSDQRLARPGE